MSWFVEYKKERMENERLRQMVRAASMTRKHFEAIAEAIRVNRPMKEGLSVEAYDMLNYRLDSIARDMACNLRRFNPSFDKGRFIAATRRKK